MTKPVSNSRLLLTCWILLIAGLSGCGLPHNVQVVQSGATVGRPRALYVNHSFAVGRLTFPPGRYVIGIQDDRGYYYQAPQKIVGRMIAPYGTALFDGGLYVYADNPLRVRAYMLNDNYLAKLPGDFTGLDYHFER